MLPTTISQPQSLLKVAFKKDEHASGNSSTPFEYFIVEIQNTCPITRKENISSAVLCLYVSSRQSLHSQTLTSVISYRLLLVLSLSLCMLVSQIDILCTFEIILALTITYLEQTSNFYISSWQSKSSRKSKHCLYTVEDTEIVHKQIHSH